MTTSPARGSILVGVDGSEDGDRAVRWAVEQARLEHRPLVLVHAVNPQINLWVGDPGFDTAEVMEAMEIEGRQLLDDTYATIRRSEDEELVIHSVLEMRDPRQVLIDLSAEAATIVVGSRGRGPVRSLLLGSVSVAVSQHARCPVVVLRPQASETTEHHVVVGLAGAGPLSSAVEYAFRHASLRSLPLTIVHGFWDPLVGFVGATMVAPGEPALAGDADLIAHAVAGVRETFPDVAVSYRVAEGMPDESLLTASIGSDLVVVGTHRHSSAGSLLAGSISLAVTEHAHCPVAVIPER